MSEHPTNLTEALINTIKSEVHPACPIIQRGKEQPEINVEFSKGWWIRCDGCSPKICTGCKYLTFNDSRKK